MEIAASLERFFTSCPDCQGFGLNRNNAACPVCFGAGVRLNRPEENLVISFPLFADFKARRRAQISRILISIFTFFFLAALLAYVISLAASFMGAYWHLWAS